MCDTHRPARSGTRRAGDSRQAVRGALHKLKIIFAKQK